jgi:anti-sigma B factor antagonist
MPDAWVVQASARLVQVVLAWRFVMQIEQRTLGEVAVLAVVGDITMTADGTSQIADRVRSALDKGHSRVILDLAQVRYVDSTGLGELVQALTASRSRGGDMKLLNVTRRVNDLLILTRLLTIFDCFDDEAAAIASFDQPAVAR